MKHCIGFDIGNHAVHIAVRKRGRIVQGISERLPEDLVKNGSIVSYEAMTDFLKGLRRKYKLRIRNAGLVLPASLCYCRRFSVAALTREQLMFNLPYGFQDFITDDKSNYFFDCSVIGVSGEAGKAPEFDVLAAAARKTVIEEYIHMFRKAGFKLKVIIPEELSYVNVLREYKGEPHRHGVLEVSHSAVKLFLFVGSRFESVRIIDYGCNALDEVIAEHFGVDSYYMAATYRENNFEHANELEGCRAIYNSIAFEVLKAVNFYRFNAGGSLEHLHCCGGGAHNEALMQTLKSTLPLPVTGLEEFFGEGDTQIDFPLIAAAAGVTMQ